MNGSCAGGTGAFIDQMATLLKMGAEEMDKAAQTAEKTYTIASRCGVFAKSDIQPLHQSGGQDPPTSPSQHLSGGGESDHRGSGPGTAHQGQRSVSGRAADLFPVSAARALTRRWASPALARRIACCLWRWARRIHAGRNRGTCLAIRRNCWRHARHVGDLPLPSRRCLKTRRNMTRSRRRHAKAAVPQADFTDGLRQARPYRHRFRLHHRQGGGHRRRAAKLLFTDYRPNRGNPIALI